MPDQDAERAADVAKVKREDFEGSAAAEAAKRVDPPAPRGAAQRAEKLEEAEEAAVEAHDEAPEVEVVASDKFLEKVSSRFDEPATEVKVSAAGFKDLKLEQGKPVSVPVEQAQALVDTPAVEYAEVSE